MDKRRPKGNLFIIVCYLCLTSGKESNAASTPTSLQITTISVDKRTSEFTTTTTASFTTNDTTTQTATIATGGTTATTATSDANTESITTSSSVISTPGSNTSTPCTGSIPQWIPTILIPVICGLLLLMIISVIVYHRYHRKHGDQPMIKEQEMNGEMDKSDVELVRFENEHVDNSKKDLHQTYETENKVLNNECSKRGDYDEVSLDATRGSECDSSSEKDEISNGINRNPPKYKILAKSKVVLNNDGYYADTEVNEGSAKEITRLQILRSCGNDNLYSEVSVNNEKDLSEQTGKTVYKQPIKYIYSSLSAEWKLKTNAENSDTSENQATSKKNHTGSSYYEYADVNMSKNTDIDDETFDATYDHLNMDRRPQRNFTNGPILDESVLLEDEYYNHIISCRADKSTVGSRDLYSKVSTRPKHEYEVHADIPGGTLERDDSNRKMAEQEKVLDEADTHIYDNIDKSIDSLKSHHGEHTAKIANKTIELQTLTDFASLPQKQDTNAQNKCKEPNPAPGKDNFDNTNIVNMHTERSTSPNGYMKNCGIKQKGGEILKAGPNLNPKAIKY